MDRVTIGLGRRSKWKFATSASGSVGAGFVSGEGGTLYLADPAGVTRTFNYGSVGLGLAAGIKLPKIGKIDLPVTVTGAPASFVNGGAIYVSPDFEGDELTVDDIRGVCAIFEVAGGLIGGASASIISLGISEKWLCLSNKSHKVERPLDYLQARLVETARAYLVCAGVNAGLQASVGISGMIGYVH